MIKNAHFLRLCLALTLSVLLAACASTPQHQSTGQYFDDAVITTKVKAALLADEEVDGLDITVETHNGVVQLGGFVSSRAMSRRARELAEDVPGVKRVHDDTKLKSDR